MTIQEVINIIEKDELYIKINEFCNMQNSVIGPYNYGYKHAIENILNKLNTLKEGQNDRI